MTKRQIPQLCDDFGLGAIGQQVTESAKRTLRLRTKPSQRTLTLTSKFGGCPHLPDGFAWPVSGGHIEGRRVVYEPQQYSVGPMWFIAQILLDELPFVPDGIVLPKTGLLSFFAAVQNADLPFSDSSTVDWAVYYHSVEPLLSQTANPRPSQDFIDANRLYSDMVPTEDGDMVLPEHSIAFEEDWTVNPQFFCNGNFGNSPYYAFFSGGPHHMCGGYPNYVQSPIEPIASSYSRRFGTDVSDKDSRLLAQFDSDLNLGIEWERCRSWIFHDFGWGSSRTLL